MRDTIHISDESRGRNADDDVVYALCGHQVRLSDMRHWYGLMMVQINCQECLVTKKNFHEG